MKIIEFLQQIGITNFGAGVGSHCGTGVTPDALKTKVNKSQKDGSAGEETDLSPTQGE